MTWSALAGIASLLIFTILVLGVGVPLIGRRLREGAEEHKPQP